MPAKVTVKFTKAEAVKQLRLLRLRYPETMFRPLSKSHTGRAAAALVAAGIHPDAYAADRYREAIDLCIEEIEEWEPSR